jgi:hypothetical protein
MPTPEQRTRFEEMRYSLLDSIPTQLFGQTGFKNEPGGYHSGVDLVHKGVNPPVRSPVSGRAEVVYSNVGFGNHVRIHTPAGWAVLMGHLSDMRDERERGRVLKNGDQVRAGEIIGHQGSTGNSTGDHVHYGIYSPRGATDPTLGLPALTGAETIARRGLAKDAKENVYYAFEHDLGMGAGHNPGYEVPKPPDPDYFFAPVVGPPLLRHPGNVPPDPNPQPEPAPAPEQTQCPVGQSSIPIIDANFVITGYKCVNTVDLGKVLLCLPNRRVWDNASGQIVCATQDPHLTGEPGPTEGEPEGNLFGLDLGAFFVAGVVVIVGAIFLIAGLRAAQTESGYKNAVQPLAEPINQAAGLVGKAGTAVATKGASVIAK